MSLVAPDFVTPAAADYRQFTVSLVKTGRPLSEGIKIRFNTDAYGYDLSTGYEGFGMAPVESTLEALAGGGSVRTHRRLTAGEMFLPITIAAPSGERVDDMVAQLADIVTGNADGFFDVVVYNPHTGETRSRTVEYKSGLETQEWVSEERRAIGLTCTFLDPYWYGTAREVSRTLRPAIKPFITASPGAPSPTVENRLAQIDYVGTNLSVTDLQDDAGKDYKQFEALSSSRLMPVRFELPDWGGPWIAVRFRARADRPATIRPRLNYSTSSGGSDYQTVSTEIGTEWAWSKTFLINAPEAMSNVRLNLMLNGVGEDTDGLVAPDVGTQFEISDIHLQMGATKAEAEAFGEPPKGLIGAYSFPFFPIFLADSTVQGEYILTVEGDSEVWPTWHITGPGRDVHITGPCGCEFIIEGEVTSPITVVTDPRRRAIFDETGLIWDRVSKEHDEFFALQVGANKVSMTMVGGSPQSRIRMAYRERWKTHLGGAGGGR